MEAFALVGVSGGLSSAIVLVATTLNAGVRDWAEAPEIGTAGIVILFALPTLGLVVGAILGRHWYPVKPIPRRVTEVIDVEPGERVSWVGRARVHWVALVLFALAVLLLFLRPGLPLWVFVLIAGVGVVFSQVEAQVTNDGMRVRLGGIPVRTFPLDRISSARAMAADPAEYGGTGWKKVPGQSALILRAGEAIAITFRDGSQFVVTVDDPERGAALLNGLIERGT
jgi:MFS family permease